MGNSASTSSTSRRPADSAMSSSPDRIKLVHGRQSGSSCEVLLFGATVIGWTVEGRQQLYVSPKSALDGSKPVRGGIPICFPNFGPWKCGPQHGFARASTQWKLQQPPHPDNDTGDIKAVLMLKDSADTRHSWDHRFHLTYTILLKASSLHLEVEVTNDGDASLDFTFAFHTYFRIGQLDQCRIRPLKGVTFTDKTREGWPQQVEDRDEVSVTGFTDRVYQDAANTLYLSHPDGRTTLTKEGLADFVVWNPGPEHQIGDLPQLPDVEQFVCVEAAQASKSIYLLQNQTWSATHVMQLHT